MTRASASVSVRVWGDYACFTRPDFKVERVSYPVPTPSAARGMLEAIFWKPQFRYRIRSIGVLASGRQLSLVRNELATRQGKTPILIQKKEERQQRVSVVLQDVAYILRAEIRLRPGASDPVQKYVEQFERRIARGQCHHAPCLGLREFAACFAPVEPSEAPCALDMPLGMMLFDIAFVEDARRRRLEFVRHGADGRSRLAKGYAKALFFPAQLHSGWLDVPQEKYDELEALERGDA